MTNGTKNEAGRRFRKLIAGGENADDSDDSSGSPLERLKKSQTDNAAGAHPPPNAGPDTTIKAKATTRKLAVPKINMPKLNSQGFFGPRFWTIASIISLSINAIVLIVLLVLSFNIRKLNVNNLITLPIDLLSGLHSNFEKMDNAHINASIPVQTTIPVKFELRLNQQTNVVLSQDVTINNARVTVQTGGLNITQALTTIVLPQGTTLPVILDLTVPVDTTVPVTLTVPVDIPLKDTQLHEPFVGLQDVVEPIYCIVSPNAVNLAGESICK